MTKLNCFMTLLLTPLLLGGCGGPGGLSNAHTALASRNNPIYNVVVLLDLSDRIDPQRSPTQAVQDKRFIRGLLAVFEGLVRQKLYVGSMDRFVITVASQEKINYQQVIDHTSDKLRIDMRSVRLGGKPRFELAKQGLLASIDELYRAAVQNKTFMGADIWSFFRNSLDDYLVVGTEIGSVRNIVVVITDGYVEFDHSVQVSRSKSGNKTSFTEVGRFRNKPHWEKKFDAGGFGLIPCGQRFQGKRIAVLVLGTRPQPADDMRIIEKYWSTWLREMEIEKHEMKTGEMSSGRIEDILKAFLG